MNRPAWRTFFVSFFLTLILFGTLIGMTLSALRTHSTLFSSNTAADIRISENGEVYQITLLDHTVSVPRISSARTEKFLQRCLPILPRPIRLAAYGWQLWEALEGRLPW